MVQLKAATPQLITSECSRDRREQARTFLEAQATDGDVVVLAPTWEAAAELIRSLRRPVFGWQRATLFRCAVELARPALLEQGLTLAAPLALEALWARIAFELHASGQLHRFEPLALRPGLGRALGRTVAELRMAGVAAEGVERGLGAAMRAFERALADARLVDRSDVYSLALRAVPSQVSALVLLDLEIRSAAEEQFVEHVASRAANVIAVAPHADAASVQRLCAALKTQPRHLERAQSAASGALAALQHGLFSSGQLATDAPCALALEDVFSAPGEARECVEIARRILSLAQSGLPFDRMAVLLRSPGTYAATLQEAFRRARIPAWFARGVPRPDPKGRALLALLACAEERLSARAFAEYLSLGQVPQDDCGAPPAAAPESARFVRPDGAESLLPLESTSGEVAPEELAAESEEDLDPDAPVTAGSLRAPRRWEKLINDAAVIGGPERWRRRLDGLKQRKRAEHAAPTLSEAHRARVERDLGDLEALEGFALPLLESLCALPTQAPWGQWLDAIAALATRAVKAPGRVLGVLQELAPMAPIGPVGLGEVRSVLLQRLSWVSEPPASRRAGHVFVAPVEAARGLAFEVVFVPGLAERIFPQKVREDPLLPDEVRTSLSGALETNDARIATERLALQLAVGAASHRAILSWPRIDAEQGRPRVPSFYALEAARAVEGQLPQYEALARRAEQGGQARLAWPAPRNAQEAIDESEFDLANVEAILHSREPTKGRARYLLDANPHLARALRARHARWSVSAWAPADGLVRPSARAREVMAGHRFSQRPFSPTALEQYAACPYRFFLSAVQRLSPLEIPGELEELGPLEKGSMAHEVQFRVLSSLRDEGLHVTQATLPKAFERLDVVLEKVAAHTFDEFVPAIERVWLDGVETLRADLREWLRRVAREDDFAPWRFELSFGLSQRGQQDPSSTPTPVPLMQGLLLRGSIDLVERSARGTLRATDYKTGKARAPFGNVVGGGKHLQPVLYALVLEQLFPELPVESGRLFYCTQAGGFADVPTKLDGVSREAMGLVIRTVGRALEEGFFPASPDKDACRFCDFRMVCGPDEERRVKEKAKATRAENRPLAQVRMQP